METISIRLFGTPAIRTPATPTWSELGTTGGELLGCLVLQRGKPMPRERLAHTCWDGIPPDRARRSLNSALWRLKHSFEPEPVFSGTSAVKFDPVNTCWVDVEAFETRIAAFTAIDHPTVADMQDAERALSLYRGDLIEPAKGTWLLADRIRLKDVYVAARRRLAESYFSQDEFERARLHGLAVLDIDELHEEVHRLLMRIHAAEGNRSAALQQFELIKELLARELDVDPMPETTRLAVSIARGQPIAECQPAVSADVGSAVRELEQARTELARLARHIDTAISRLSSPRPR